jgi:hypothetical protein
MYWYRFILIEDYIRYTYAAANEHTRVEFAFTASPFPFSKYFSDHECALLRSGFHVEEGEECKLGPGGESRVLLVRASCEGEAVEVFLIGSA